MNIINLIQQSKEDEEAYLVLMDLAEETGLSFNKKMKPRSKQNRINPSIYFTGSEMREYSSHEWSWSGGLDQILSIVFFFSSYTKKCTSGSGTQDWSGSAIKIFRYTRPLSQEV